MIRRSTGRWRVLGDLKAETSDRDSGIDDLAAGIQWLAPIFTTSPEAVRGLMIGLRLSYLAGCHAAGRQPDDEILAPVMAVFQRLEPPPGEP